MISENIVILLVEDNKDFAKLLSVYLDRFEKGKFSIVWKENAVDALKELAENTTIDVVLMDYFLPGKNGLEITKEMMERKIRLPVVFLTVNKDFDVVIKVMKLGVADYLVKEEISSPVLPRTILSVIEKHRLRDRLMQIEVSQQRLNVIRETVSTVLEDLQRPLFEMKDLSTGLRSKIKDAGRLNYLRIVDENLLRIIEKLDKLKELKEDKTIQYIKDIKMLDLS
jgi:response regulator of citrate/malate metabolism